MENRKDIGKAFREKLDGLQKAPGDHVWQAIKDDLPKKKKRRAIIFWWFISVPTALLVLGLFGYPLWENYGTGNAPKVNNIETGNAENANASGQRASGRQTRTTGTGNSVATESTASQNDEVNAGTYTTGSNTNALNRKAISKTGNKGYTVTNANDNNRDNSGNTTNKYSKKRKSKTNSASVKKGRLASSGKKSGRSNNTRGNNSIAANTTKNNEVDITNDASANAETAIDTITTEETQAVAENKPAGKEKAAAAKAKTENTKKQADTLQPEEEETVLVEVKKKKKQEKPSDDNKRMFVYGFVAPGLYSAGDADYIDPSVSGSDVSVEKAFGYGLYLGYNITPKWSIRAGFVSTKLELQTDGLYLSGSPADYTGIKYAANMSNTSIVQRLTQGLDVNSQPYANFNISHKLQFVDVPVEATYTFYGTKFRLGVIGGVTARFVTKNEMFAENNLGRAYIGEAVDDKMKFGAGLGAGLVYKFTPSIQANVEPMARYYFDSPDYVKPFVFTIQAGLQYNFNLSKKKK